MNYPYMNPYFQPVQPSSVIKVNGENGARAYQLGANSSALLLDESGLMVWLVVSDGAGYKTVTPYDITPHQIAPAPDFGSLESRIKRLEEMINDSTDSNTAKRRADSSPDKANDADGSFRRRSPGYDQPSRADESANETGYGAYQGIRERP